MPDRSYVRRWIFFLPFSLFLPAFSGLAQGPALSAGDIHGITIERSVTYNGKALYGYIDGGADLYYEYGFRRAVVQEIVRDSLRIHIEIFEMDSPAGAAGIFSVTRGGCFGKSLWDFECASRFQAQSARGRYFIRAANVSGTPAEEALTLSAARLVAAKAGDTLYSPPSLFLDSIFQAGKRSFLIAQGPLGVQNGLPEWTDLVQGLEKFHLWVLLQEAGEITTTIGVLEAPASVDLPLVRRWVEEAPCDFTRIALADGLQRLLLCETNSAPREVDAYSNTLGRYRAR